MYVSIQLPRVVYCNNVCKRLDEFSSKVLVENLDYTKIKNPTEINVIFRGHLLLPFLTPLRTIDFIFVCLFYFFVNFSLLQVYCRYADFVNILKKFLGLEP